MLYSELWEKISSLEDEKRILKTQLREAKEMIKNLKEVINKFQNNEKQNNKIDPKKGAIVGNEDLTNINFTNFYDVIICIDSIKDITKGWEIKMSQKAIKEYKQFKNDKVLKIGVIGNSNKGKSFILSKISKINLPSGRRTEGLSIKYPNLDLHENRQIALLDSSGLESPIISNNKGRIKQNGKKEDKKKEKKENENIEENEIKEDNKIKDNEDNEREENIEKSEKELFKDKLRDKIITELFLQSYIIHNSDIILAVVGPLTFSEQKLLNRIKIEIKKNKINKPLYIIHNLKTYTRIQQVEEYIKDILLKSATFDLEKQAKISTEIKKETGVIYYEKNSIPKIFHLIYANEYSKAGDYYNNFTLKFIEHSFQNITDLTSFDVIETVKKRFLEISNDIIENYSKELTFNYDSNNKLIKLEMPKDIILKKCFIEELGFSNLKSNGYEPNYNYYKKDDKIIVRVEVPGNSRIESKIDYIGEYSVIILTGNKKYDKEPEKFEDNIYNSREFGNFELNIVLRTNEYLLKNEQPKIIKKNGVLLLEYSLVKNNKAELETKSDEEIYNL